MSKPIWTVARFEIVRQLKKPAFWIAILAMPVMMAVIFLIAFVTGESGAETNPVLDENTTVAITDEAGVLPKDQPFNLYATKEEGIEAVKEKQVDLYYFLQQYAAMRVDELDVLALTGNFEIADYKLAANGEDANALGKAIIPIAILALFFIFVALFGNRFLLAVVEEKENRVSEMILTAVSAKHLIVGKIIAMMSLGVIQMLMVIVPVAILILMNCENAMVSSILGMIEFDPAAIAMNVILFIASVFFYAGTCMLIGSMVSTARDASQFIGPAIIAMVFPLYFMQVFLATTPGVMVYVLSYFPLSAPIALMLRSSFGTLNMTEFVIGVVEVSAFAVLTVWLAIKTFQKNAINFENIKLLNKK